MEQNLEDWIEREPGLLQTGLTIVGRQVGLEGGRLDLLARDTQAGWVVIEIKSGDLRRETIAQALDYASCIATMPHDELKQKVNEYLSQRPEPQKRSLGPPLDAEEAASEVRDVAIFVVGTGRAPGLENLLTLYQPHRSEPGY